MLTRAAEKVHVIPNWADLEVHAHPRPESKLLSELGLADRFVVQYADNIVPLNGIPYLVDGMSRLLDEPRIHFLFVGQGAKSNYLSSEVGKRSLPNATLLDWMPRCRASELHQACDLALISLMPGLAGIAAPSRVYNVLASGRPILAVVEEKNRTGPNDCYAKPGLGGVPLRRRRFRPGG